jgi:glycosyltransferase involved in cell wall biosynthesis
VSIRAQTYKNIELIVVDNFSIDTTATIAKKYTEKFFEKGPERSAQRNYGAAQATGEYVVFIDSDMELTETVIASCVEKMASDKSFAGVIIPEESFGEGFWAQCKKLERSFYVGVTWMEAARFFKKSAFDEVGGYDSELISGEDWDLSQRVEKTATIARISSLIRHNEGHPRLVGIIKKKLYYAGEFSNYKGDGSRSINIKKQTNPFLRYALFFKKPEVIPRHPLLFLGMLTLKTLEFFFGGIGYLLKRKTKRVQTLDRITPRSELPFVSYILPTFNADKYLDLCLTKIFIQDYPKDRYEVIVADGLSTDSTRKILSRYPIKLIDNPSVNSDFGKYSALKIAKGELIAFIDSDNIIVGTQWLKSLVKPFQYYPALVASESNYLIAPDFTSLNTYANLLVIVDPLARLLASSPILVEKTELGFMIQYFRPGSTPVAGANGFLWRATNLIPFLDAKTQRFAETNVLASLADTDGISIANTPGSGIYHYYCIGINDYIAKRKKIAKKYLDRRNNDEKTWVDSRHRIRQILSVVYLATFIGPLIEAIAEIVWSRQWQWLWHPFVSSLTVYIYSRAFLQNVGSNSSRQ